MSTTLRLLRFGLRLRHRLLIRSLPLLPVRPRVVLAPVVLSERLLHPLLLLVLLTLQPALQPLLVRTR